MARLYVNENLPDPTIQELRRLGHDVMTMGESGHSGRAIADSEVLDFATSNGRTVVTLNRRHFVRLHRDRPAHAAIVVCSLDHDFKAFGRPPPTFTVLGSGSLHRTGSDDGIVVART